MPVSINGSGSITGVSSLTQLTKLGVTGILTATDFSGPSGGAADFPNGLTATTASFSSNLSVGGNLTVDGVLSYEDVTNVDAVGVVTARAGVKVPDSQKIFLGTGDDLKIYHDGSINRIRSDVLTVIEKNDSEDMASFMPDGAVVLFHNGSQKFETTSAGIKVSGSFPDITIHDTDTTNDNLRILHNGGGTQLLVDPNNVGPNASHFIIGIDGTERLHITSGGTVGIDNANPDTSYKLDVAGAGQFITASTNASNDFNIGQLTVRNTQDAQGAFIDFRADSNNGTAGVIAKIGGFNTFNGTGYDGALTFSTRKSAGNTMNERLRITKDGKIGIGEASPDEMMEITNTGGTGSQIQFRDTSTGTGAGDGVRFGYNGSGAQIWNFESSYIRFATSNVERLHITSAGLVGVNCTNIFSQFQVKAGTNANIGLTVMSNEAAIEAFNDAGSSSVPLRLRGSALKAYTSSTERLQIYSDGRVRIRGNNANSTFTVSNTSGTVFILDDTEPSAVGTGGKIVFGSKYYTAANTMGTAFIGSYKENAPSNGSNEYNHSLLFGTNSSSDGISERMRITSGGLMGLGTNSPGSYIGGGENFVIAESGNAGMTIATGTSNTGTINFADGTSGDARYRGRIEYSHSLDALDILTAASTRVRIDSTGRLLVNTLSASNGASYGNLVLEFAGNSYNGIKTRDTDNTGTVTHLVFVSGSAAVGSITGDTGQAYYNNLSDYRRKENDVEIADGIQKLKLLRPIRFNYISDPNTVCDGFFAHEVTPAVPTAVTGAKDAVDSEGEIDPQMLDASKLVPLLTAALQEAITKIEALEARITALEGS